MTPTLFSALAEPHRLSIVELLCKRPFAVNEIVEELNLRQPQVSKHLKALSDAGLVSMYPVKNTRIYSLKLEPFLELDHWLQQHRNVWEKRLDRLDLLLKKEMKKSRKR